MIYEIDSREKQNVQNTTSEHNQNTIPVDLDSDEIRQVELRRLMYERIAHGNALAEIEETDQRKWRRK